MKHLFRYAWPLPWTVLGVLGALAAGILGARFSIRQGVLEVHGGLVAQAYRRLPPPLQFEAITLGHVVLGLSASCMDDVRAHEQVHVRQYERWGPLFVPAYLSSSAWQMLRGRCPYRDNRFEREAYSPSPTAIALTPGNDTALVK